MVLGNFLCGGVPLFWFIVGLWLAVLAVGARGGYLDFFLLSVLSLLHSPSLGRLGID